jgi:hypothetical protein
MACVSHTHTPCFLLHYYRYMSHLVYALVFFVYQATLLEEEVKKLSVSLDLAHGSTYENKLLSLMSPVLETMQHTDAQVRSSTDCYARTSCLSAINSAVNSFILSVTFL